MGKTNRKTILLAPFLLLSLMLFFSGSLYAQSIRMETLDNDKVTHYYRSSPADDRPWLFTTAEQLFNVVFPDKSKLPFGKSVAFLVGVSKYNHISTQLPFVENDLADMKNFLLGDGGFDHVYVVKNEAVDSDLIEDYLLNRFFPPRGKTHPQKLDRRDRFLFYYSGHGGDRGGSTGYMQFANAKPGNFAGNQVMPMRTFQSYTSDFPASHLLFIFDCCNSGLGFDPTPRSDNSYAQLVSTLSRNGSRTIITAGTAKEKTFEVKDKSGRGNGVFTRAFLNALKNGRADSGKDGFITIDEVMARVKSEIAEFSSRYNQKVTPRDWQLDVNNYEGTFVFVNPGAKAANIALKDEILAITGARSSVPAVIKRGEYGILSLYSNADGEVYIDDIYRGKIVSGDEIAVPRVEIGRRKVEIRTTAEVLSKMATIEKGKVTQLDLLKPATTNRTDSTSPSAITDSRKVFRATPSSSLSKDAVKTMLKKYGFYSSDKYSWSKAYSNPNGKGFANQYEKQENGQIIYDRASNLSWQQSGSENDITYEKAKAYIRQLNEGDGYAGFTDWRLPTLEEGMSLMEKEKLNGDLYIDPVFAKTQRWIWTSDQPSASAAWVVGFFGGICFDGRVGGGSSVRAVRSGQSAR